MLMCTDICTGIVQKPALGGRADNERKLGAFLHKNTKFYIQELAKNWQEKAVFDLRQ